MKNKNIPKKIEAFLLFLVIAGCGFLLRALFSMDEIWQYTYAYLLTDGKQVYEDFSMVVTPFSFLLSSGFIGLFGKTLLSFRILGAVTYAATIFLFYNILCSLKVNRQFAFSMSMLLAIANIYFVNYDYNVLNLLFLFACIRIFLSSLTEKKVFVIGILATLMIFTKQSTGALVWMGLLVLVYKTKSREEGRFKSLLFYFLGSALVSFLFLAYLFSNHIFLYFWNQVVLGVFSFSENKFEMVPLSAIYLAVLFLFFVADLFALKKVKEKRKELLCITFLAVLHAVVIYPILDVAHIGFALFPMSIPTILLVQRDWQFPRYFEAIYTLAIALILFLFLKEPFVVLQEGNYRMVPVKKEVAEALIDMDAFFETHPRKDCYILDGKACMYFMQTGVFHKYYDIFLRGNFGTKTDEELAKELLLRNGYYLIPKDESKILWQVPIPVLRIVLEHTEKTGETEAYFVFENKKEVN